MSSSPLYAFTGRGWDAETGLYFYRTRYYYPVPGWFTARDPIGLAVRDVILYGYVSNDPVNLIDSNGRILIQFNRAFKTAFATNEARVSTLTGQR